MRDLFYQDIEEDDEQFVEFYPKLSSNLLSSSCIQQKKAARKKKGGNRPDSRLGNFERQRLKLRIKIKQLNQ